MRLRLAGVIVLACASALAGSVADARPAAKQARHDSQAASQCVFTDAGRVICPAGENHTTGHARVTAGHVGKNRVITGFRSSHDPRPAAWCGWWLRQQLGVADRLYNLARAWARYGRPAHGPAIGTIVVWRHHVGIITGRADGEWVVKSGNDGHRVRERPRSLAGVIAFRWPNGMAGL